eukprot:350856-Chlamydomonas_euryale.AAC.2
MPRAGAGGCAAPRNSGRGGQATVRAAAADWAGQLWLGQRSRGWGSAAAGAEWYAAVMRGVRGQHVSVSRPAHRKSSRVQSITEAVSASQPAHRNRSRQSCRAGDTCAQAMRHAENVPDVAHAKRYVPSGTCTRRSLCHAPSGRCARRSVCHASSGMCARRSQMWRVPCAPPPLAPPGQPAGHVSARALHTPDLDT